MKFNGETHCGFHNLAIILSSLFNIILTTNRYLTRDSSIIIKENNEQAGWQLRKRNLTFTYQKTIMYSFSYFKEKDKQVLLDFMEAHPFAFLTGSDLSGAQVATQVPVLFEERNGELFLQGHIMRNTDHHKAFVQNPKALAVFTGPSTYVSASWYTNPQIGSTWNYMSIHISGQITFMPDEELIRFMKKLTLKFEKGNTESKTIYDNLPDTFLGKMMPAIAGFELKAEKIDNVFKLSQNRDEKSYLNIISKLEEQGGDSALIAQEMKKRKEELFPPGVQWDAGKFDS
jgi:transcriptional regulator